MDRYFNHKHAQAFTLVELLVVVGIIVILSLVAIVSTGSNIADARDAARRRDFTLIQSALQRYYFDHGNYPTELKNGPAEEGLIPRHYLTSIPVDPGKMNRRYLYSYSINRDQFELATTLENDGDPLNYEAYVVGNGDGLTRDVGYGRYILEGQLAPCSETIDIELITITNGPVSEDPLTGCLPFDPNES